MVKNKTKKREPKLPFPFKELTLLEMQRLLLD
jgi:hypothetical protein